MGGDAVPAGSADSAAGVSGAAGRWDQADLGRRAARASVGVAACWATSPPDHRVVL